jgi:hypothetical protein
MFGTDCPRTYPVMRTERFAIMYDTRVVLGQYGLGFW